MMSEGPRWSEWRRIQQRLAVGLSVANITGALIVFVFLGGVVPVPSEVAYDWDLALRNLGLFVPFVIAVSITANVFGPPYRRTRPGLVRRRAGPRPARAFHHPSPAPVRAEAYRWDLGGRPRPVHRLQRLRVPAAGDADRPHGRPRGPDQSALAYLLDERIEREIIAAALVAEVPAEPEGPGVEARVMLGWALGGGIPLLGAMLLALAVLLGADVSPERFAGTVLFIGTFGLAFGLVLMRMAARSVAGPVESTRSAQRQVEAGDLDAGISVYDGSEIGLMQAGFNRMVAGLRERERLHDLFGRHVGEEVARRALERGVELGGEVRECAAVFVDVVGSTELAATRPAPEVVELLNRFFAAVIGVVHRHGGLVNKFEGDAALCIFGAPLEPADAASRALSAARELRERLRAEVPELRAAIGVSFGEAVAGNVGAAERYEYTVIGDPVNEAARLTELAKESPAGALASEAVLDEAGPEEASRWRLGEEVTLRGKTTPTRIAEPDLMTED
jgi:adenylate cyclase